MTRVRTWTPRDTTGISQTSREKSIPSPSSTAAIHTAQVTGDGNHNCHYITHQNNQKVPVCPLQQILHFPIDAVTLQLCPAINHSNGTIGISSITWNTHFHKEAVVCRNNHNEVSASKTHFTVLVQFTRLLCRGSWSSFLSAQVFTYPQLWFLPDKTIMVWLAKKKNAPKPTQTEDNDTTSKTPVAL